MKGLIFTYALTYGGALVSLFNPFYGLLVYICFAIIKPEQLWHWSVPVGNYSRIVAIALLVGWVIHGLGNWDFGRARWIVYCALGFFFASVLSALAAPDQKAAWEFVESMGKIILPFVVGMTLIRNVSQLKQVAWVMVISQGYLAFNENLTYVQYGLYETDNGLAHMMTVGSGVSFFLAIQAKKRWAKLLAFALAGMMAHAVMFHMSRGGMLGLVVVGLLGFWLIPKRPRYVALMLVGIGAGFFLAGPSVREEFSSSFSGAEERDESAQSRFDLWRDMWTASAGHRLLGIGPNHWPLVAHNFGWPKGKEGHGLWVQMPSEIGVPGGLLYFMLFFSTICLMWPLARGKVVHADEDLKIFAWMVIPALGGFIVEAQFGSFEGLELPYYVVMLGAATLTVLTSSNYVDESALGSESEAWTPTDDLVKASELETIAH